MAFLPQSVEGLKDFDGYRHFMKERLKLVAEEPLELFISKNRFDFEIKGKPWAGRVVLLGDPKGLTAVKQLKKEGLLFRSGTCRLEGEDLRVEGIAPKLVKDAQKTFQKLLLGCSLIPPEGPDEDEGEAGTATLAPEDAEAHWKALKAALTPEVKAALARNPEKKEQALALLAGSAQQEKAQDWAGAIATFEELRTLLGSGAGAQARGNGQAYRQGIAVWDKALDSVERELGKLKQAVLGAFEESEADPAKNVEKLDAVMDKLDQGLRAKLEQASSAKDEAERAKLQAEVDAMLKKIASSLGKDPMIKSLDANPFLALSIRSTLAGALKEVSATVR
jgi:hypothetical protein